MLKKKYRLCVIADWQALQIILGDDVNKRSIESQVYIEAARTLNMDYKKIEKAAEITYCETGRVNELDLDKFDFVLGLEGSPSDFPYLSMLLDTTYDLEPVELKDEDGKTTTVIFGLYKEYLCRLCRFMAEIARTLDKADDMLEIYENAVMEFDEELAYAPLGRQGNIYDSLSKSIASTNDELITVYVETWKTLKMHFQNLMLFPPEIQASIFGKPLIYDKTRLEEIEDEFLLAVSGIDENQKYKYNGYDFVIGTFVEIYTENE